MGHKENYDACCSSCLRGTKGLEQNYILIQCTHSNPDIQGHQSQMVKNIKLLLNEE